MAVENSLTKTQPKADRVEFEVAGETIVLTPQTVRDYLVSGDKERVTMQEVVMFINLCKYAGLNPWLKEAYCIKYGNEPATMVVGKEVFMKRAEKTPGFDGMEAGIIVMSENEVGDMRKCTGRTGPTHIVLRYPLMSMPAGRRMAP